MAKSQMLHENFEIKSTGQRERVVRPDRFEASDSACRLICRHGDFEVIDYSTFGVSIFSELEFPVELNEFDAEFKYEDITIATLRLRQVRSEKLLDSGGFKTAFELMSGPFNVEKLKAAILTQDVLKHLAEKQAEYENVPQVFKNRVYQAKDVLGTLEQELSRIRSQMNATSYEELAQFESTAAELVSEFLHRSFTPVYKELAESLKSATGEVVQLAVEFFRTQLRGLLYQSPFSDRSVNKPLGYAGDYEMMNVIYRNELFGDSIFAKALHRYWLKHPEAQAVRNRAHYLEEKIFNMLVSRKSDVPLKFLSVASGPAREVQLTLSKIPQQGLKNVGFHLLDQDLLSLKHAQQRLREILHKEGKTAEIKFFNQAIKNVISKGLEQGDYDLIYSAGLFDYFSDPVAKMAAQALFNSVKPGGRLIVGNFNITTPNQFTMELALDWKLIYRSPQDLKGLFGSIGGTFEIEQEAEGVNLFCVITKPKSQ